MILFLCIKTNSTFEYILVIIDFLIKDSNSLTGWVPILFSTFMSLWSLIYDK